MSKLTDKLYTNPKQSNRLLQIGLPTDSADCYYLDLGLGEYSDKPYWGFNTDEFPCWSVGRLIAIYEKCTGLKFERKRWKESSDNLLEDILEQLELAISDAIDGVKFDFSKLNE